MAPEICIRIMPTSGSTWLEVRGTDDAAEVRASLLFLLGRCQPHEVSTVLDHLRRGAVDGDDGRYCFIGIVARCRGTKFMMAGLTCRETWPFETWLRRIHIGDTPRNHAQARLLEQWLVEWLGERTIEMPAVLMVEQRQL